MRAPASVTVATLVAVFAALSPTALAQTCGDLTPDTSTNVQAISGARTVVWASVCAGDAAGKYVLSRRDGAICDNSPCDVDTVGADDHSICCTVRRAPSPPARRLPLRARGPPCE